MSYSRALLRSTSFGFVLGSSLPFVYSNLNGTPSENTFDPEDEFNLSNRLLNLINSQAHEDSHNGGHSIDSIPIHGHHKYVSRRIKSENQTGVRDALYWAGF